jgi:hypothetical protein
LCKRGDMSSRAIEKANYPADYKRIAMWLWACFGTDRFVAP